MSYENKPHSGASALYLKCSGILAGKRPLPENLCIGDACNRGHGTNGKAVRYKSNNGCVLCVKVARCNRLARKDQKDSKHLTALRKYEDSLLQDDDDPLFSGEE